MRNIISLTDEQIEERFEELGISLCSEEVVFTRDSINDFISAARGYNEHGRIVRTDSTLIIKGVQIRRGERRGDLYVIDFGEVRGCYQ